MADSIADLENMTKNELLDICKEIGITGAQKKKKQELIYDILEEKAQKQGLIFSTGILEILPDGYGFLRGKTYLPGINDIYVSQSQIRRFDLRMGDVVSGQVRPPKAGEKYYGLLKIQGVNSLNPEDIKKR
ncbi:Rho termination factor N-terminal domain-containing protein, partial [bacterium]|nr:Rho termination factor N-terminal domain-containing protein [bacterium]